jgi:UDP-3-O-[3-hydroxymyristoyl] N-acetylglucosamine deacetylase
LRNNQRPATQVARQKTLKTEISCVGTGLHSGSKTRMTLRPAEAGTGIVFRRTDIAGSGAIPANWANVVDTRLCSRLANAEGASVATVEHLMSALAGLQVDNCLIEIDGPEVPAMDGSASPFVFLLDCAGIEEQAAPRRAIEVLEPVSVGGDGKKVVLEPATGFRLSCMIDFPSAAIARQSIDFALDAAAFREEVSRARTFGFAREVEQLRAAGLARGGSLDNAVVVDGDRVLNREGLRFPDEFVRHKLLDAIGDFYLAGAPMLCHVRAERGGHELNNAALRALFAMPSAWRMTDLADDMTAITASGRRAAG